MSKPSTMQIVANFDVAQVSPLLECTFNRVDVDSTAIVGKNAGSVAFKQGEEVTIQINAGAVQLLGGPKPFIGFRVVDCTFTTRPRVYRCGPNEKKVEYALPSMFEPLVSGQTQGATVVLPANDFPEAPVAGTPPGYFQKGRAWTGKLIVGQLKARWRLTLMVTVAIEYVEGAEPEMRVFEIDPEVEVGSGSGGKPVEEEEMQPVMAMMSAPTCEVDPEVEVGSGSGGKP